MNIVGFLLDVEGTIVGGKSYEPVPGAVEFVRELRRRNTPLRLITNNTTDAPLSLLRKLHAAGFDFALEELHTCIEAAVRFLRDARAARCLVLGSADLKQMFQDSGLAVVEEPDVDAVVVGLDTELTYARLQTACEAVLEHRAAFVALHRNRVYTDAEGRRAPSVGPIVEAIRYATQAEPRLIGKPSPDYYRQALDDLALEPGQVMVVSDDPLSDLAGAKRMGMQAAFVLSGKYPDESVLDQLEERERPDIVVKAIGSLPLQTLLNN